MSATIAIELVNRLKDDEAFRKTIRSMNHAEAWQLVKKEGFECSEKELKQAYDHFDGCCGVVGPKMTWREAVKTLCQIPLSYPGTYEMRKS